MWHCLNIIQWRWLIFKWTVLESKRCSFKKAAGGSDYQVYFLLDQLNSDLEPEKKSWKKILSCSLLTTTIEITCHRSLCWMIKSHTLVYNGRIHTIQVYMMDVDCTHLWCHDPFYPWLFHQYYLWHNDIWHMYYSIHKPTLDVTWSMIYAALLENPGSTFSEALTTSLNCLKEGHHNYCLW